MFMETNHKYTLRSPVIRIKKKQSSNFNTARVTEKKKKTEESA